MENRFSFRDFVLAALMLVLIVMVGLAMMQYDREWDQVQLIRGKLDDQAKDLRALREQIAGGVAVRGGAATTGPASTHPSADPFARLRAVEAMPDFAHGDWILSALAGKSATLTPIISGDAYATDVQDLVFETLAQRDPQTLEWTPLLASSWTIEDHSKEYFDFVAKHPETTQPSTTEPVTKPGGPQPPYPVVIHFMMRDGVHFSDGEPLTADDVVFTFDLIMNPKINAPRQRAYYQKIAKVEKTGPNEVTFSYREPYFQAFEYAGGLQVLPKHFYSKYTPEQFNQSTGLLMGSGPYRMEQPDTWTPDQQMELLRNERYWGVAPPVERIVWRVIDNDIARLTAFRNGDIDTYTAPPEAYVKLKDDPDLAKKANRFEYFSPTGGYRFVAWNELQNGKPSAFADKRVRRALAMLVDRERLMREINYGYAQLATGPFSPLSKQYDPDVKAIPFDVEQGKRLLADAGFTDRNGDGVLEGPDGKPFHFKLTYPSGVSNYERMALFLKDSFARAGVAMDPDPLEWSVFQERLENKNFDAISMGWTAGIESDVYQMFDSSQAVAGGDDFMSYKNPQLDGLMEQARATLDEDARMHLWRQCHRILNEDQPYMFLWFGKSLNFVDKRFENVHELRTGLTPRTEWFVPQDKQRWTR